MAKLLRVSAAGVLVAALAAVIPGHAQQQPASGQPPSQPGAQQPAAPAGQQPAGGQATPPQPAAGAAAQDPQQPIFRAGINFVRVDVIVTDRSGNPIADLKPEDFEVTEQGQAQRVETFKLISLDGGLMSSVKEPPRQIRTDDDEQAEAAREDVRLFGIFLDDYHVRLETGMQAREQLARFIQTQLGPSDMVGLMYPLQPTDSVRMTRNHDAIVQALQQFRGRKYDYAPRNQYEERYAYYPAETVERIRNQVSMSALKGLMSKMGALKEGRKALILVSEGYTNMLPPQLRDPVAAAPGVMNPARGDPNAGVGNPLEDRAAFSANADLESDLRLLTDMANRNNIAIYAVDPRGLSTGEFGIDTNIGVRTDRQYLTSTMETLRALALQTDGRAIVNRNDITVAMKQIVQDTSAYYLLGYNSTFTATDGKFHEIKVRVKRPGVQVRARRGYWAFSNEDAQRALAPPTPEPPKAVETALAAISAPSRSSRLVRTWIGTDRGANGRTKVTLVWEPVPPRAGEPSRPGDAPARMSVTATAPDGSPYFRGRAPGTPVTAAPGSTTLSPGAGGSVSFEAAPGTVQLRLAVESADSEVLDSELRDIVVPDLTGGAVAIGTPEVFRARTVRELQQVRIDPNARPTASREFSRTERVLIRVPTYGASNGAQVTARLLNRTGDSIADLPVAPSTVRAESAREIDLALNSLPAGEYLVEISVSGAGEPVKELIGFRIAG
jgi:VWFA-related protein